MRNFAISILALACVGCSHNHVAMINDGLKTIEGVYPHNKTNPNINMAVESFLNSSIASAEKGKWQYTGDSCPRLGYATDGYMALDQSSSGGLTGKIYQIKRYESGRVSDAIVHFHAVRDRNGNLVISENIVKDNLEEPGRTYLHAGSIKMKETNTIRLFLSKTPQETSSFSSECGIQKNKYWDYQRVTHFPDFVPL